MYYKFTIFVPVPKKQNSAFNITLTQIKVLQTFRKFRTWRLSAETVVVDSIDTLIVDPQTETAVKAEIK